MLVRLWKKGDVSPPKANRIMQNGKRYLSVPMAMHDVISHYLGKPCILILPKRKGNNYPLVHARNIVQVINHESLHCALLKIGEETGLEGDKNFDNLLEDKKFRKKLKRTGLF
jgi:hypothetical protein